MQVQAKEQQDWCAIILGVSLDLIHLISPVQWALLMAVALGLNVPKVTLLGRGLVKTQI